MSEKNQNIERVVQLFREIDREEVVPFNKSLGLRLESLGENNICIKFDLKEELIGNIVAKILHGGVIAAALDTAGGFIAAIENVRKTDGLKDEQTIKKMMMTGTIDLRIDYLRPGQGKYFLATGSVMRMGNKIAVTRMKLHNDKGLLIAVGTGTYMLG